MIIQDDRTPEQRKTHTEIVIALDTCMSYWGQAKKTKSYAAWACHPYHAEAVLEWVQNRSDMSGANLLDSDALMIVAKGTKSKGQCHIYVVGEEHPALQSLKEHSVC